MSRLSGRVRALARVAIGAGDPSPRTAAAFTLGVFFGFSPFLGLQVIAAFSLGWLFRLNRLVVFCGLSMNLPWFLIPWYVGTTLLAASFMGHGSPAAYAAEVRAVVTHSPWQPAFWHSLVAHSDILLGPFLVGPTVGAALVATATYPISRAGVTWYRRHARHTPPAAGPASPTVPSSRPDRTS
jgi:uncharacterized protein (DUF2062 family)